MPEFFNKLGASFSLLVLPILALMGPARAAIPFPQSPNNELKIVGVLFEDFRGDRRSSFSMQAGGEVSLTFQVAGFQRQRGESPSGLWEWEEQVHLKYQVELRDPEGLLVLPAEEGEVKIQLGPRDQQWQPAIHWSALVPTSAPSGDYEVRIRVSDQIGNRQATHRAVFRVRGESVRPSESLQVQQVEYASSAGGPWFARRVFALTTAIHIRYKVVGFHLSPAKEVWVEQDWMVLDPEGNVIVTQANAAVQKQQSFYPLRFLATTFDLKLEDPVPGEYTLRIDVRDRIGQQEVSIESNFTLRP